MARFTKIGQNSLLHGAEAARQIRALQPDLLLLDIQMPGLDGFGVVDAIGKELHPHSYGDSLVVLHGGAELKLSRSDRQKVEASLGQSL